MSIYLIYLLNLLPLVAPAATFDEQRAAMRNTVSTQPEAAILSLLEAGLDEGKAVLAISETQKWLRQNQPENPTLLYRAARAAELSGDLKGAVALYQQYLTKADLNTPEADEAVYAVYTLLLERLNDTAGAYAFSKNEGDRLLVCPRAKQFDKWFLDQAVHGHRNDALAVANRLRACIDAGLPNDLLLARYDNTFRWLLGRVSGGTGFRRDAQVSQELVDACKELASVITFDEELKLRLDWNVSVRFYVQQKLAEKEIDAPIAEAEALLAKYPRYAEEVQLGWAGGTKDNHHNHSGDTKLFWEHELEAKLAPVVAAAAKLTVAERAGLVAMWRPSGYWRDPRPLNLHQVKAISDYLKTNPKLTLASTYASALAKSWEKYSPEEALAIAPQIQKNRHADTSLVRAIAAGATKKTVKDGDKTRTEYGRDLDKMLAALRGPEAWRFTSGNLNAHHVADRLWHYCGRPGGNEKRDQAKKTLEEFRQKLVYKGVKADAPANQRIAEFNKLWADYRAPQPKIPDVSSELRKVLQSTPEVIPSLLKDPNPEAQKLVREAVARGFADAEGPFGHDGGANGLNLTAYSPWIDALASRTYGGMGRLKNDKNKYKPHRLEPVLEKAVAEGLKRNVLESWLVMAWINVQFPENNDESVKLMQALYKSPTWKTLPAEILYGARQWFRSAAMTDAQAAWLDAGDPAIICKDLLSLTNVADVATTAAALSKAIDGVKKSPVKVNIRGLQKLASVTNSVFIDPKVMDQVLEVADGLRVLCDRDTEPFAARVHAFVTEQSDPVLVSRTGAFLWSYGLSEHYARSLPLTMTLAQSMLDEHPATAAALAKTGLVMLGGRIPEHPRNWAERNGGLAALKALYGKAAMTMGLVAIPVPRNHPAYPIYKSQAEWMTANEDSAWTMLNAGDENGNNWDQLVPTHRALSVDYLMWVLQRTIYSRNDARMEELIKPLLEWAGEPGTPWSKSQQIDLEIAYGDIAMQLGQLDNAHKIFVKTQQNEAYVDTIDRHKATLRRVMVERIAKRFDDALKTLMQLDMEKIPELWSASRYARAEVYYDMEEFGDAADDVEAILGREPDHEEATIMQGRIHLARQKLMEASELDVGSKNAKNTLVPGEDLKVTLKDPTLAVSGAGTEIEVAVWTTSGDKEHFFLRQFGDQKTKFRGEVRTALGAPMPDDDVLQVIGDDEIYYAYSERFRKKMNNMAEKRGGPITVRSDAILMASARKLLSEAEQRVADMEAKMAAMAKQGRPVTSAMAAAAKVAAAREAVAKSRTREDRAAAEAQKTSELTKALLHARVKPGRPINVRVIDPDASRTAGIDQVAVSIESSSGDSIGRIVLKETDTHSGWFEGTIPTAGAQAMAFARNTEPGRNPNMVISPTPGYPAWRPVAQSGVTPEFKIDLNDNVALGEMTITAKESGATLQKFVLQTGMNAGEMTTIGVFPKDLVTLEKPWHPSVTIMNDTDHHHGRDERSVYDLRELEQHLDRGWMTQRYPAGVAENVAGPSAAMTNAIPAKVQWKRNNHHHNAHVIYRFRGYFHEPEAVMRRFKVELGKWTPAEVHGSVANPAQYTLTVDGRRITTVLEKPPAAGAALNLEGEINLRPGVHRIEIWATGWDCRIGFGRSVKLLANLDDAEKLGECPDSFFDPETFPKGVLTQRNGKATIIPREDGTQFTVKFAPGSSTRLVNLVLLGQEGPIPAINKIALTDSDGEGVLPVPEDYATLNKNDTLEILTGDKVAVRYVDDRFVDKAKEKHERFLNVSFSDASLGFVFFEMRKKFDGLTYVDTPYYEGLLRFEHGKPLTLKVTDPDMDMTDQPDTVEVVLESKSGGRKTFIAKETEPSSAIFQLVVIPVPGAPANERQFQMAAGGTISATYRDEENIQPGVPVDRYASVRHAVYAQPRLRMSHATVTPIDYSKLDPKAADHSLRPPGARGLNIGFASIEERRAEWQRESEEASEGLLKLEREQQKNATGGLVRPGWAISNSWEDVTGPPAGGIKVVHGQLMEFEIEAPHLALRAGSSLNVFVQTDAGRARGASGLHVAPSRREGGSPDDAMGFDLSAPGTMKLSAVLAGGARGPDRLRGAPQIPIYTVQHVRHTDGAHTFKRSDALFACKVPLIAGFLPEEGALSDEELAYRREKKMPVERKAGLVVRPGEKVHVGIQYKDAQGVEKWLTGAATVTSHPVLDVMDEDYREEKSEAYAGEELHLRVVDLGADISDASDRVEVLMQAKSGAKHKVELLEVDTHSGVFRGTVELSYAQGGEGRALGERGLQETPAYSVKRDGFPVVYGDTMGARYTDANGVKTDTKLLTIMKGADGTVWPFSKQYDDETIAMRTQFSLAEAFLEMAKRHRKLGEVELANLEYERAKDMLEKAMDMFRDPDTRAQAEYLLGNLTQEEADVTEDKELQEDRYRAALSRYMRVTGSYPDTLPASKAQFKIATVYERMNEPEIAAQEYVKLAYKYPDSEFLALSMARLGTHFQRKAASYEKQAKELLAKTDDKDAQFDGKAMQVMTVREYIKSAEIFGRLQERFPDHELAGKGGLRAGQAYMRAGENRDALNAFKRVFEHEAYDGPKIRAQAMYWAGMCYEPLGEPMAAYSIYKRLTYDFPESKWAAYARSQLSSDRLLTIELEIEEKRVEEGR
ncbi:MAG: tetratricopeptide repeat protein [Verrucomicrobia bacterium]|nr:tetratricopeptide repeat protein [Verrucomicrobiota bacterium]MBT7068600.1 tetratricopeptide repeat protein [Verrucomicrobiota bacterium]